jgi:hypothetical protein
MARRIDRTYSAGSSRFGLWAALFTLVLLAGGPGLGQ